MKGGAKTIVITGATRGIGRALTDEFARLGHVVLGCGRDAANVRALAAAHPAPHAFEALDVRDDAAVRRWAERVLAEHGAPDLLINNAALMNALAPLWEVSAEEFDALVDVNVKGVANVIRHFVPAMIARGRGVIVNLSSGWGRSVDVDVAPYCTTKWAIEGLSRALALELPAGLACVPLSPGVVDTEMLRKCWADGAASAPDPEPWARTAVPFLLELGPRDNGKPLSVPTR
ncbi:MAG: SDR family NAD(P)-dependent oxidoreductase [Planctomycetes bacterium]|nr:SDR family NAD(P)-dependent oxidoreductase [Planctomycetota bacterium]